MLAILFTLLVTVLVGYPLVACCLSPTTRFRGDLLELGVVVVTMGSLVVGWLALVTAELGIFSIGAILGAGTAVSLTFFWFTYRRSVSDLFRPWDWLHPDVSYKPLSVPFLSKMLPYQSEYILLLGWVVLAVFLFFRPHQFITGAADAGVYVNLSAHIAKTGSILVDQPLVAELDPAHYDLFLRPEQAYPPATHYWQPALFVTDQSGRLTPQFYHLHPVWQAVGYALSGLNGALYFTGYWALLSCMVVYLLARRWLVGQPFSRLFALIALAGMSFNALQVWFARYPTTEPLTQLLFLLGFYALAVWAERSYEEPLWGILAGLAWGSTFLARIDSFFILIVPAVLLFWLCWQRKWQWTHLGFFLPLLILPLHSVFHAWGWSRPYFNNVFGFVGRVLSQYGLILAVAGGIGVGLLWWVWRNQPLVMQLVWRHQHTLKIGVIMAVVGLFLYGWFVRPYLATTAYLDPFSGAEITLYNNENLLRLGWYLSPIGVFGAMLGICVLIWHLDKTHWAMLLMGLIFSLLYIYNARNNQHQIYVMRRYLPVVLPFFIITAVWGFAWLARMRQQLLSLALAGLWLLGILWLTRGFVSHVDYVGFPDQLAVTAAQFDRSSVIVFSQPTDIGVGDFIGAPLYFLHDIHSFVWREGSAEQTAAAISNWQADGYTVYWVTLPDAVVWPLGDEDLELYTTFAYQFPILEHSVTHRPTAVDQVNWSGEIYQVRPLGQ